MNDPGSLSLYDASIPVMIASLRGMAKFIEKGRAHGAAQGLSEEALLDARLADTMMTLIQQVQRASDTAKFAGIRVAGMENVAMPDTERSFAELQDRIARTIAFLETVPADAFNAGAGAEVVLKTGKGEFKFIGRDYVLNFALPNFYFHVTTAYDLLRWKGVPVNKPDYLGWA